MKTNRKLWFIKTHSLNSQKKYKEWSDNCKSVPDPNQTHMGPNHKNGKIRPRLQRWEGLQGG